MRRLRSEAAARLPPEPTAAPGEQTVSCMVRLPQGSRISRRFRPSDPLRTLFDFVDSSAELLDDQLPGSYRLVAQFPRRVFTAAAAAEGATLSAAGLASAQETLLFETLSPEPDAV